MRTQDENDRKQETEHSVDLQDVNRLLDLGKLLSSILAEEELKALQNEIMVDASEKCLSSLER